MNIIEKDLLQYIKQNAILEQVFDLFVLKYESYGVVKGVITLTNFTQDELEILIGFFQKNYIGKKSIKISALDLKKALLNSKFDQVEPKKLLQLFKNKELISKKEAKGEINTRWNQLLNKYYQEYKETLAGLWIQEVLNEKGHGYVYLQSQYDIKDESSHNLKKAIELGIAIVNHLPCRKNEFEYLALFSTFITGNPHTFDENTKEGNFLFQLIKWVNERNNYYPDKTIFKSLTKLRMYYQVGILKDDISNYAIISNIDAIKKDNSFHQGIMGFKKEKQCMHLSLSTITQLNEICCKDSVLYIVENPSVFSKLLETNMGEYSIMCMNGQPNLSSLLILDLLKDTTIYYAGDFDPEGLLIAYKLKQIYNGEFNYWMMSLEHYKKAISNKTISESRLKSLDNISDELLHEVIEHMKKCGLAGYQEQLFLK